jgi:hypothetical protein
MEVQRMVVQDNQIALHIQVEELVVMDLTHIMLDLEEPALEHSEVVVQDKKDQLDHLIYLFLHHLEVVVDLLAEQEEGDQNLLR